MAEAVVLATRDASDRLQTMARYFTFDQRPRSEYAAVETAMSMVCGSGDPVALGDERVGRALDRPFAAVVKGHPSGVRFPEVARTAGKLLEGRLVLARLRQEFNLPVTRLVNLGRRGPYHMDLNGMDLHGEPRGPFDIHELPARSDYVVSDYPCLWSHDHEARDTDPGPAGQEM